MRSSGGRSEDAGVLAGTSSTDGSNPRMAAVGLNCRVLKTVANLRVIWLTPCSHNLYYVKCALRHGLGANSPAVERAEGLVARTNSQHRRKPTNHLVGGLRSRLWLPTLVRTDAQREISGTARRSRSRNRRPLVRTRIAQRTPRHGAGRISLPTSMRCAYRSEQSARAVERRGQASGCGTSRRCRKCSGVGALFGLGNNPQGPQPGRRLARHSQARARRTLVETLDAAGVEDGPLPHATHQVQDVRWLSYRSRLAFAARARRSARQCACLRRLDGGRLANRLARRLTRTSYSNQATWPRIQHQRSMQPIAGVRSRLQWQGAAYSTYQIGQTESTRQYNA
jgi:hypothetical protein